MKTLIKLLITFSLLLLTACQERKNSTGSDIDNKSITFKVGDLCRLTNVVLTATSDSNYSKVQVYINDAVYNDTLRKMEKEGIYIQLMSDECFKIAEVFDEYVKVKYINRLGNECLIRIDKKDIKICNDSNKINPIRYPINISKYKVDSLYKVMLGGKKSKTIGEFKLGMSKWNYNKQFDKYVSEGRIYQYASDGTMAYTLKFNSDRLEAVLFPTFKNGKLNSLRCELWDLDGGDASYKATEIFKNMFGDIYYRNGEDYYWFTSGTKALLRVESCSQGEYEDALTSVVYFK